MKREAAGVRRSPCSPTLTRTAVVAESVNSFTGGNFRFRDNYCVDPGTPRPAVPPPPDAEGVRAHDHDRELVAAVLRKDRKAAASYGRRGTDGYRARTRQDPQGPRADARAIGLMLLWRYWEQRSTKEMAAALATTEKRRRADPFTGARPVQGTLVEGGDRWEMTSGSNGWLMPPAARAASEREAAQVESLFRARVPNGRIRTAARPEEDETGWRAFVRVRALADAAACRKGGLFHEPVPHLSRTGPRGATGACAHILARLSGPSTSTRASAEHARSG